MNQSHSRPTDKKPIVMKRTLHCQRPFLFWSLFFICSFLACFLYLNIQDGFVFSRFRSIGINTNVLGFAERLRKFVYILNYVCALGFLLVLPFLRRHWIAWPLILLLGLASAVEAIYGKIYGRLPTFTDVFIMNTAIANIGDSILEHSHFVRWELLRFLLIFPLLGMMRFLTQFRSVYITIGATLCLSYLAFSYSFILYKRGEPALVGFPPGYSYLMGTLFLYPATSGNDLDMLPVPLSNADRQYDKIVFIIDESIADKAFMDVDLKTKNAVYFPKALSGANCSAASNYFLRRSVKIDDHLHPSESLFQTAKKAGYKTIYYDNQRVLKDVAVRNYFSEKETAAIDEIIEAPPLLPQYAIDSASLVDLKRRIENPGKIFVIVNKIGAHFPYNRSLPENLRQTQRLSSYKHSVKYNSIDYFNKLTTVLPKNTIIFYTSDHGQRPEGPITHCSSASTANVREWQVPMIVSTSDHQTLASLNLIKQHLVQPTHFDLTESVRNAMGFGFTGARSFLKALGSQ